MVHWCADACTTSEYIANLKLVSVVVTYWMNRLQNLTTSRPYFVTLNATDQIDSAKVIRKINYTHPHYSFQSAQSQSKLPLLNGVKNTYFCGSYFGNGFHEDAVRSAVKVAEMLVYQRDWAAVNFLLSKQMNMTAHFLTNAPSLYTIIRVLWS